MGATPWNWWMPTRPFGVVAAINRMGAATGSLRGAAATEGADFNGHRVELDPPSAARRYWVAGYMWAGWNVIGRGSLEECIADALREHARGALGSEIVVEARTEEDAEVCRRMGLAPHSDEARKAHEAAWRTPLHDEVNAAFENDRHFGIGAVGMLANSGTIEEYRAKLDAAFAERKARRQGRTA